MFALEEGEMGQTEVTEHHIEVTNEKPFKERPWNMPEGLLEEVKEHLDHMLEVGAITPSNSAWSNAVVLVQKKGGGLRFCIDFRKLNAHTKKDAYLLPCLHDAINTLMQSCLGELNFTTCLMYLDDFVIFTMTQEEHLDRLRAVLE